MSWIVTVSASRDERMAGVAAIDYASPPHDNEDDARALIALITDSAIPAGPGPWRYAIAGGQQHVALHHTYTGQLFP